MHKPALLYTGNLVANRVDLVKEARDIYAGKTISNLGRRRKWHVMIEAIWTGNPGQAGVQDDTTSLINRNLASLPGKEKKIVWPSPLRVVNQSNIGGQLWRLGGRGTHLSDEKREHLVSPSKDPEEMQRKGEKKTLPFPSYKAAKHAHLGKIRETHWYWVVYQLAVLVTSGIMDDPPAMIAFAQKRDV